MEIETIYAAIRKHHKTKSHQEIADILGISKDAVRYRAKQLSISFSHHSPFGDRSTKSYLNDKSDVGRDEDKLLLLRRVNEILKEPMGQACQ